MSCAHVPLLKMPAASSLPSRHDHIYMHIVMEMVPLTSTLFALTVKTLSSRPYSLSFSRKNFKESRESICSLIGKLIAALYLIIFFFFNFSVEFALKFAKFFIKFWMNKFLMRCIFMYFLMVLIFLRIAALIEIPLIWR